MGFKCGIVGLPNVGKSTLFNALTQTAAAQAANYPFCTIEPNLGEVAVPDPRLETLAKIAHSDAVIPTRLTFVDIAGLVRGASKGEGLRQPVPRPYPRGRRDRATYCAASRTATSTHVEGKIDPIADAATVETELMLADLDSLGEARSTRWKRRRAATTRNRFSALRPRPRAIALLSEGKPARLVARKPEEEQAFAMLGLITAKPILYVCNVEEASAANGNVFSKKSRRRRRARMRLRWSFPPRSSRRSRCCRPPSAPTISLPSASRSPASTG